MKAKHVKTLRAIFTRPTLVNIVFADIESVILALGGEIEEGTGSRISIKLQDAVLPSPAPRQGSAPISS